MDNSVIIVGATSGIGRELAGIFVERGWRVGITGRRHDLLDSFKTQYGQNAVIETSCFDVMGDENILQVSELVKRLGRLDLLIYNAGYGEPSELPNWKIDKKTTGINVNGFIEIVHWAFGYFLEQGHGHIAATSSVASTRGNSFAPAYSASKAFISTYLEGLYMKAHRLGKPIFVTDIQPGFVKSKEINVPGQFWVVPLAKAANQIYRGIEQKRFRVFVSKRWSLVAFFMRLVPLSIYKRFA